MCVLIIKCKIKSKLGMESQTIQLEAFNTDLNGSRILLQGPFMGKYPQIQEYVQQLRNPFKKKILISNTVFGLSKYLPLQYDANFQVRDSQDWTLILTYITYAPKPLLVVAEDINIPDGLWQKINRTTTIINISTTNVLRLMPYDAIFFSPIEELSSSYGDYVYKILQSVYRQNYSVKEHKEIVQELRVAGAGLVWTRMNEEKQNGSIYWYDPITKNSGDYLSNKQISEMFSFLSEQFKRD